MALEIVTPSDHDAWLEFLTPIVAAFNAVREERTPAEVERSLAMAPLDFRIGIRDESGPIGGCSSFEADLSLPGGRRVPVAALSGVGVDPTKRGRGAMRAMLEEHLRRARDRGHAASILNASEASLYGRFGYGVATSVAEYRVRSDRAAFAAEPADSGSLEMLTAEPENWETFSAAYDAAGDVVAGTGGRDRHWWEIVLGEKEGWIGGGKQLGVLHRNAAGEPDGYALYATTDKSEGWVMLNQVDVKEFMAATVEAELALFGFLADLPLTGSISWPYGPVDSPIRHHLADPRQLQTTGVHDVLWLRPLDVEALLAGRTYRSDGEVTIEIEDPVFDDLRGPWSLSVSGGEPAVARTGSADLVLTPGQLASGVLGETRIAEFAAADVLDGPSDAVAELDRLLLTDRRPFNLSKF